MVVVDPKKIARAMDHTKPTRHAPAQSTGDAKPFEKPNDLARRRKSKQTTPVPTPISLASASEPETIDAPIPTLASSPVDPVLFTIRQLGRTLDDIERMRIMNGNRIGAGQREGIELPWMDAISTQMDALEHSIELELKRAWRKHPLAPWAKAIPGAGELLMARLIAEIDGDRVDKDTGEIRPGPLHAPNRAKLLAFCGHGDPARAGKIPKGATQEELFKRGSPSAKKATWKLAYQFMRTVGSEPTMVMANPTDRPSAPEIAATKLDSESKPVSSRRSPRSPYRDIYDERKAATEGKLHDKECVRCGPAGKPAKIGSPWSDAHRHADALRIVGKRFLIDLWVASRDLHKRGDVHYRNEVAGE